jgi:hypothetical protein
MFKFLHHADRAERIAERDSQPGVFSETPDLVGAWSWKVSQQWVCTLHRVASHDMESMQLREWTRNPWGSARRGSKPLGVASFLALRAPACQL